MESTEHALAALSLRRTSLQLRTTSPKRRYVCSLRSTTNADLFGLTLQPSSLPLPPELFIQILGELSSPDDTSDYRAGRALHCSLARCCVVSKAFFQLAQPILYDSAVLTGYEPEAEKALYATLMAGRASLVRKVNWYRDAQELVDIARFCDLLTACTRLQELHASPLRHCRPTQLPLFLAALEAHWSRLKCLHLADTVLDGDALLNAPSLRVLRTAAITFSAGVATGSLPLFHLKQLTFEVLDDSPQTASARDFAFLVSSSIHSLQRMRITFFPFDLSPLSRLDHLSIWHSQDSVDGPTSTLLFASSSLRCLDLWELGDAISASSPHDFLHFLHAFPPKLEYLTLDIYNETALALRYLKAVLQTITFLPHLRTLRMYGRAPDEAEARLRAEFDSWAAERRSKLVVEWG